MSEIKSATWLMGQHFPPMQWVVPGVIPQGSGILAGTPKVGKSWMALDIAVSVAGGLPVMGIATEKKPVLYLSLEDSWRRLQDRLQHLLGNARPPEDLALGIDADQAINQAKHFAERNPHGVIILDTTELVKTAQSNNSSLYRLDYEFGRTVKEIAPAQGTLIGVHHTRKQEASDPMHRVSGTQGVTAAADFMMVLDRERNSSRTKMHVTGRDLEENCYAMLFENARWTPDGGDLPTAATKAAEITVGKTADAVAKYVNGRPATIASDVETAFGISNANARKQLSRLHSKGLIGKDKTGVYIPVTVSQSHQNPSSEAI